MSSLQPPPRGFRLTRCTECALPLVLCICRLDAPLDTTLPIHLVLPRTETRSTTNTARLLKLWLPSQTQITILGEHTQAPAPAATPAPLPQGAVLLFPTADAAPLDLAPPLNSSSLQPSHTLPPAPVSSVPSLLVVPDGTWSQARRLARREMLQHQLPTVSLERNWSSTYSLRRRSRGLCTFEAVAIALAHYDNTHLAVALLQRFSRWQHRSAMLRTGLPAEKCATEPLEPHPAISQLIDGLQLP